MNPSSRLPMSNQKGTRRMIRDLSRTLRDYDQHHAAAIAALSQIREPGGEWTCIGGTETDLTENGMEVTFDFRRHHPGWRAC